MRTEAEKILKKELRILAITTRERLKLTQNEMSQKLLMSESSYSEFETGRSMCGTLTTALLYLEQEDINACLNDIKRKLELEFQLI